MKQQFEQKKILITGGTGSVGQIAVREVLKYSPAVVRVLDVDETREVEMKNELKAYSSLRFLLGDVRDKERLRMATEDIDIILHFASLKHVSACEYNPFEAVKTNVIGTQNIINVALEENVEKVVFTSSDKAVNPCNVMGATKLLAEKLITAANYSKGKHRTVFCSTRFGNVMGSRGSIIPIFKEQALKGGPITITDEKMTRFVLSISDSVKLLMNALRLAQGGEVFVPKMPSVRIIDLANAIIDKINPEMKDRIKIDIIGRSPGEKLFEELMTADEAERSVETKDLFVIKPELSEYLDAAKLSYPQSKPTTIKGYSSAVVDLLTVEQIGKLLEQECLL